MFIPVIQEIVDSCFLPLVLQELLRGRLFFVCVQISELSSATDVRDRSLPCQLCCVRLLTMPHLISHVLGGWRQALDVWILLGMASVAVRSMPCCWWKHCSLWTLWRVCKRSPRCAITQICYGRNLGLLRLGLVGRTARALSAQALKGCALTVRACLDVSLAV